jgi:hypothetical protein
MIVYRKYFKNPPMKPAVSKILAITFMIVCAVSCKKSDAGSGTTAKSKTILMTQASWKLQSVGLDNDKNGVAETDITGSVPACQFDNIYTFKADSTGTMDESTLKCNATDPQTKPFTWLFKSNETMLSGTFGFSDGDATIISITDNNLTVTYDDVSGGITNHILAVLKH